jgi:hypothetical protein
MAEKRKQVIRITTGSKALDNLIGGGIESMRSAAALHAGAQKIMLHRRQEHDAAKVTLSSCSRQTLL